MTPTWIALLYVIFYLALVWLILHLEGALRELERMENDRFRVREEQELLRRQLEEQEQTQEQPQEQPEMKEKE